jgi:ABC-type uncharacterized transport system ATPase subunit
MRPGSSDTQPPRLELVEITKRFGSFVANEKVSLKLSVRQIRSPYDAHKLGIGMVYQYFTVVPAMTVAENLLLARPDLPHLIHWSNERLPC